MSWATCYSGTNNIHFDSPPIMADGRNFASWQPEAVINQRIKKAENIQSNWDYRRYMTHNGIQIMEYNMYQAENEMGSNPTQSINATSSTNTPFLYKSINDNSRPSYGYRDTDLKNPYLTREQLEARMLSPSITVPMDMSSIHTTS